MIPQGYPLVIEWRDGDGDRWAGTVIGWQAVEGTPATYRPVVVNLGDGVYQAIDVRAPFRVVSSGAGRDGRPPLLGGHH